MKVEAAQAMGLLSIWLTALSIKFSRLHLQHQVSFDCGVKADLAIAIRAKGNILDQVLLLALLVLALDLHLLSGMSWLLWPICLFLGVRVLHTLGVLLFGWLSLRQLTYIAFVIAQLLFALERLK